jgi:UPF0176 protein
MCFVVASPVFFLHGLASFFARCARSWRAAKPVILTQMKPAAPAIQAALAAVAAPHAPAGDEGGALVHSAFYKLIPLPDVAAAVTELRQLTQVLQGMVWVAPEGINGTVAGPAADVAAFEQALRGALGGALQGIRFKHSECRTKPFSRMKVMQKPGLIPLQIPPLQDLPPCSARNTAVSPHDWRDLIAQPDVVLLDNRNSFEYRLGHFAGAVDPQVAHFRDFPAYVQAHAAQWQREGKRVAMYCTGGIRCEKTAPWMASLGLDVYQLEGGILNYFESLPDAQRQWQGECFVFDNRIALDTQLRETSTTLEQVYDGESDGQWRIARAKRLRGDST